MNDLWRTPPWLFKYAEHLLGGIDFDAACNKDNALAPPVAEGFGDALKTRWHGRIWCNPPYSDIDPWADMALSSGCKVALLIPSPNGEARYKRLCENAYEIHIIGRVGFLNESSQEAKGNRAGSSLFIIGDYTKGQRIVMERDAIREWRIERR